MRFITLDFETYYGGDYTLSKMTTEAYVRDPRFECLMMAYKINDDPHQHCVVGADAIQLLLDNLDVPNCAVLAHHAHFDGLILNHHFGYRPKAWFDTLSMARALHGIEVGNSLGKLMEHYNVGLVKGHNVVDAKGKRLSDFSNADLAAYKEYCKNDVEGTKRIFNLMLPNFSKPELKLIDMLIRMFTEPRLELDVELLAEYKEDILANKMQHLLEAGVQLDEVMSNDKFAEALKRVGVIPPMKTSRTTGKLAYAFAKTDEEFTALLEHPNEQVQTLVAARLQNKSTINETRAQRMMDMAMRGPACLYYKYAGANQTHRVSGGDLMNWQNLQRGGTLRDAVYADEGYVLVVVDSANIEARVLDWLAMQMDMLHAYREADAGRGPDIYCVMATKLFGYPINKKEHPKERQAGKTVKLACGYQMGGERYQETARLMGGLKISMTEACRAVAVYRAAHPMVVQLWNRGQNALATLAGGATEEKFLDSRGVLRLDKERLWLPNGLALRYPGLKYERDTDSWVFQGRRSKRTYMYGGKLVENAVQALAKIIVMNQLVEVNDRFKQELGYQPAVLTTHDEGGFLVPEDRADEVLSYAKQRLSIAPPWAPDLPVSVNGDIGIRYGDAK